MTRPRFLPDNFTLLLIVSVLLASLLPCQGTVAVGLNHLTNIGISLLFFLHGAKLSREAALAGLTHWRLHLTVLAATFAIFPILGLVLRPVLEPMVTPALYLGFLFICVLPSTVQSSIAFTSVAHGNIPAAVCAASASSIIGIFITPLLVGLLIMPHSTIYRSPSATSLADLVQHPIPPRPREEVDEHGPQALDRCAGALVLIVLTAGLVRPVDHERLSLDVLAAEESPIAAVR